MLEELLRYVLNLRKQNINRSLSQLRFLMQETQDNNQMPEKALLMNVTQFSTTLDRIDKALFKTQDRTILNG